MPWYVLGLSTINSTSVSMAFAFLLVLTLLLGRNLFCQQLNVKYKKLLYVYLFWVLVTLVRGVFVAHSYWEWKAYVNNGLTLFFPLFICFFSNAEFSLKILRSYYKIAFWVIPFCVLSLPTYEFFWANAELCLLLVLCFPLLKFKWKLFSIIVSIVMILGDFGARSQIIRCVAAWGLVCLYYNRILKNMHLSISKKLYRCFFILPVFFAILAFSGIFNVLNTQEYLGDGTVKVSRMGETSEESISIDTRSGMYKFISNSLDENKSWLWGNTNAGSYDGTGWGGSLIELAKNTKDIDTLISKRFWCESLIFSILLWMGVIGVILYSLFYFYASYLAVFRSNNIWMRLIGIYVAFRWSWAWIDDHSLGLRLIPITIWILIGMCFSVQLRTFNNMEFRIWFHNIFK